MLLLLGELTAVPLLELLGTKEELIDGATIYLRIYFLGMPFMMIYNFGSAILRSIGDTQRPFYALLVATVVNAVLDWLFVAVFGMSVDGVAIATVIANVVNAAIIIYLLVREPDPFTLKVRQMSISTSDLRKMLHLSLIHI